jgi:endoglucanase Acf2
VGGPVATHQFWAAKNWYAQGIVTGSGPYTMFPQPLGVRITPGGLTLGFYNNVIAQSTYFYQPYEPDLTLGVAGLNAASIPVSQATDWTVDFNFGPLVTRVGRGMPFVYATTDGSNPTITFSGQPAVFANQGNILGVSIANNNYGLFCPAGGRWSGLGGLTLTCNLPSGHNYFSLALLPDQAALSFYARFAFSFPVNTAVNWNYNEANSQVTTTYTVTTEAKEGAQTGFLQALYPHHYAALSGAAINTPYTYLSSRGTLKVLNGATFTTADTFHGVLPFLPPTGNYDAATLQPLVAGVANEANHFPGQDTYAAGKDLNRIAQLLPVAQMANDGASLNKLKSSLENYMQTWLNPAGGASSKLFYYDRAWGTLIGYPAAYGSDTQLNDHHFHYGYWIQAAALLGLYDPNWIQLSQWGGMINLLARDIATTQRKDSMFPFLRHFDLYGGHSWASGQAPFGDGQNEESISEAVNAWAGLILFASETGNQTLRDAAIWMYTMDTNAAFYYWFNDGPVATFPSAFTRTAVANVFDGKSDTGTWFSAAPEMEHGITFLPFTGASLYLGRDPAYAKRNLAEVNTLVGGSFSTADQNWPDLLEMYQALYDPSGALAKWNRTAYVFDGESRAHEYCWLKGLIRLGRVQPSITANTVFYSVFQAPASGVRTHVSLNLSPNPIAVKFSDGTILNIAPRTMQSEFGRMNLNPSFR